MTVALFEFTQDGRRCIGRAIVSGPQMPGVVCLLLNGRQLFAKVLRALVGGQKNVNRDSHSATEVLLLDS